MNKAIIRNTRRCSILVVLLFAASASISPQAPELSPKEDNLYSTALFASLAEMQKQYGKQRDAIDYRRTLVQKDPEITDGLPTEHADYRVEYLDREAQIKRYKESRKTFPIFRIHPVKILGPHLTITVSVSYVSLKKGRLMLAVSDWSTVEFHYDCGQQKYLVSSVKLEGI